MPYTGLNQIPDSGTRRTVKLLMDRIAQLEQQLTATQGRVSKPLDSHLDANNQKLQNLAAPSAPTDAVHLKSMQEYVATLSPGDRMINPAMTAPADATNGHAWVDEVNGQLRLVVRRNDTDRVIATVTA
ncbi:MAG TPA: hypothetical protein VFO16_24090 [Pseudonocardiaceae bacterium]|nr:hypothetical protein [Pseudonocardiaceae bacterium]